MTPWLLLFAGLIALVAGAELLVRGASALAARLGISPLIVGLTVVAFGTSAPEVAVSLSAVAKGQPDLALGNAVGSNTFNILIILGLSALIRPLTVHVKIIRFEIPLMIAAAALLWILLADAILHRAEAILLLAAFAAYTALAIRSARKDQTASLAQPNPAGATQAPAPRLLPALLLAAAGLALAVLGARWLVAGAVDIAQGLGISQLVIGLTIVAAGTSLPEVATSIVAALRGQRDIAIGNVVGSNIFNILAIVGLAGTMAPDGLPAAPAILAFDLPVMLAASIACLPIAFTHAEIRRWEGAIFIAAYAAYAAFLILDAARHDAISGFSTIMLTFALPLALLGVAVSVFAFLRSSRRANR